MKRKRLRFRIYVFCAVLILPTVIWGILSLCGAAEVLDYDTGEKRNKHEIADGTNAGTITSELEEYYDDRVPFRSVMLSMNSALNWITEIPYNKAIEPALISIANVAMGPEDTSSAEEAEEEKSSAAPIAVISSGDADPADTAEADQSAADTADTVEADQSAAAETLEPYYETPVEAGYYPFSEIVSGVIQGRDGWLFTSESYDDYTGINMPSDDALNYKLSCMLQLNEICRGKEMELHIFAIPNKNTVYPEYMPTVDQASYSALNMLEDYVHANSDVNFEYLDTEMLVAKNYGRIYYMHDTHWNERGALAACREMHKYLGLSSFDPAAVEAAETTPYVGDLMTYTGLPEAEFETEYTVTMNYKPEVAQTCVRGGDEYIDEFVSEGTESDKTAVIVGDSYRNALRPYLSKDYAHVYFINQEALWDEGIADILNSADVLIVVGVQRNIFHFGKYETAMETLINIMQ